MNNEKQVLIKNIKIFIDDIEIIAPEKESLEWYLLNNLKEYFRSINDTKSSEEVKRVTQLFSRFCVESMDWDTDLFKKCSMLTRIGFHQSH